MASPPYYPYVGRGRLVGWLVWCGVVGGGLNLRTAFPKGALVAEKPARIKHNTNLLGGYLPAVPRVARAIFLRTFRARIFLFFSGKSLAIGKPSSDFLFFSGKWQRDLKFFLPEGSGSTVGIAVRFVSLNFTFVFGT